MIITNPQYRVIWNRQDRFLNLEVLNTRTLNGCSYHQQPVGDGSGATSIYTPTSTHPKYLTAVFGGTVVAKRNEAATNEQQAGDKEHHPHRILGDLLALKACESSLQQHVCLRRITRHLTNIFKVTSWVCIEHETRRWPGNTLRRGQFVFSSATAVKV